MTVRVGIVASGGGQGPQAVERLRARIADSFETQRALRRDRGRISFLDLGSPATDTEPPSGEATVPRQVIFFR